MSRNTRRNHCRQQHQVWQHDDLLLSDNPYYARHHQQQQQQHRPTHDLSHLLYPWTGHHPTSAIMGDPGHIPPSTSSDLARSDTGMTTAPLTDQEYAALASNLPEGLGVGDR